MYWPGGALSKLSTTQKPNSMQDHDNRLIDRVSADKFSGGDAALTPTRRDSDKLLENLPLPVPGVCGSKVTGRRSKKVREDKVKGKKVSREKVEKKTVPCLKIMHWNAEGVFHKADALKVFLFENSVDVCCVQETHLQEGKTFKIRGYQVFRSDRQ